MCVKMNENIAEIIAAENLKRFGKYVLFFLTEHIWMKLKSKHKKKKKKKNYINHCVRTAFCELHFFFFF